jgi:hypothetical protein
MGHNTVSDGAGTQDLVRWAISSRNWRAGAAGGSKGCWGSLTTLGECSSPKTRQQGMTWNVGADGAGVNEVPAACGGGLQSMLGASMGLVLGGEGTTTLGELWVFTLGHAGAGQWVGRRDRGASAHHDSEIS